MHRSNKNCNGKGKKNLQKKYTVTNIIDVHEWPWYKLLVWRGSV